VKVSQRVYKFGGQPVVNEYVGNKIGAALRARFGERQVRMHCFVFFDLRLVFDHASCSL
jgi:hypothetical protein